MTSEHEETTTQAEQALDTEAPESDAPTIDAETGDKPKKKRRRRRRKGGAKAENQSESQNDSDEAPASSGPKNKKVRTRPKGSSDNQEIFDHEKTFADLGLSGPALKGLERAGFEHPTFIQSKLIPVVLSGADVLGQAKTGTGKTAAFGLPLIDMVEPGTPFEALVLAPTRELAIQIHKEIEDLGFASEARSMPVYGGQSIRTQADQLAKGPEIIVGTPGRVMDMVGRGYLHFNNIQAVVLDEVDRMLDMGFREDIRKILRACPDDSQTIFVSATLPDEIERLARGYMNNPEKIVTSAGSLTASLVDQYYITVEQWDKKRLLKHLLKRDNPELTLIFCRLKRAVDDLETYLRKNDIDAYAIHADMSQSRRNQVMTKLRDNELKVVIASDLASRGIDVDGITHVINYDLPEDVELYVHRIGRTARAGQGGTAWSFVTPEQGGLLTAIENLVNTEIPEIDAGDFEPGQVPPNVESIRQRERERLEMLQSKNRFKVELPSPSTDKDLKDPSKFPGGVVPTKLPPRLMRGKVKGRR